jgi:UDPglucose 6-dehydrogenase
LNLHDPAAQRNAKIALGAHPQFHRLEFHDDPYEGAQGCDALLLLTEWKPYRSPDFARLGNVMRGKEIFDGRNQYEPTDVTAAGFRYHGMGR